MSDCCKLCVAFMHTQKFLISTNVAERCGLGIKILFIIVMRDKKLYEFWNNPGTKQPANVCNETAIMNIAYML